jgi:hypothetical protein
MGKPPLRRPDPDAARNNKARLDELLAARGQTRPVSPARATPHRPAPNPTESRRMKNLLSLMVVLIMAALSIFERPIFVLMLAALVPSMLAWLVDDLPRQRLVRTVVPLNLASTAPFALQIWFGRNSLSQAMSLLGNPFVIMTIYSAAGFGWVLYYLAPMIVHGLLQRRILRRRRHLTETQKSLVEEWGEEVATLK